MRNNMSATDAQIQSIKDLTAAQQKLGVIDGDVQVAGAQELSTYLTKTESIKKLIPAMNDMLAQQYGLNATQEQAVTIAQMMGKVLDGQVGALSRYGYRFDDAQEAVLKNGKEQQKVAMLAGILTKYIGGVNTALAATPEGKWKQHQNAVGDLRERIGGLFVEIRGALYPAFEAVSNAVERLTAFFEANKQSIMGIAETVGNILSGAFNIVGGAIMFVVRNFKTLLTIGGLWLTYIVVAKWEFIKFSIAYFTKITLMTKVTTLFTAAAKGLKLALDFISKHPWVIAITAAIGITIALVSAFRKFNKEQRAVQDAVNGVAAKIGVEQRGLNQLFEALKKTNPEGERRKALIDQLNAKYPGLLNNQNLMRASIDEIAKAQTEANKALAQNIFLQDLQEKKEAAIKSTTSLQEKLWGLMGADFNETQINSFIDAIMGEAAKQAANPYEGHSSGKISRLAGLRDELGLNINEDISRASVALFNEAFKNDKLISTMEAFGRGRFGITGEMISNVNGGLLPGGSGSGGTNPLANTTEAIATGGTRNTTVNIHLGKMQAAEHIHYSGGMKENADDLGRMTAENMFKVLGIVEKTA
jgi:hypothetical protein